jgi:subtilisin family serine protease
MMDERLELFESDNVGLENIYDASTCRYAVPWPIDAPASLALYQQSPEDWHRAVLSAKAEDLTGVPVAFIDTGVVSHHPLLRHRLAANRDFTGEGIEDEDGHGSHIAVLFALNSPRSPIVIAKAVGRKPVPYAEQVQRLADGILWAVDQGANLISLSVGRRGPCRPQEAPICRAVSTAIERGVAVGVAAEATCPATCHEDILTWGVHGTPTRVTPVTMSNPLHYRLLSMTAWQQLLDQEAEHGR